MLIAHLFLLFQLPCSDAKSISIVPNYQEIAGKNSSRNSTHNALDQKTNSTSRRPPSSSDARSATAPAPVVSIKRIKRARTDLPKYTFTFDQAHLPCDYDVSGSYKFMDDFPKYCRDSYEQRFMSEAEYRMYMLYQTEGFFFGQYHERMIRFEKDVHTFDYTDTGF
ncbi:uncharacterized protein LOC6590501 [Drosophila persimilis]|uniref:uncharacterized protein LOC6590501 n=1 Tax=Drosophila persimilis TaxID=7234 RepID=UPI000F0732F9|nr:uncharacterized protein LOC6590501 [Drosophila persimilis]